MPSYITSPQPVQLDVLWKGKSIAFVNNAANDSGVTTTQQVSVAPEPGSGSVTLNIINTTNQTATLQASWVDVTGNYQPVASGTIATDTALEYNLSGGWIRFTFTTAPTSGSLVVTR